ncbi:2Fe-2S iron-sulfur cluster-binding protein [Streptomyces sp. B21-083]|uniref:2Fe-2S iron-sulfur cluster-binding protein n=1 Tax=Streptomyces sp. B21-083 TaxID=3039410 RepID=UPI002FF22045
MMIIHDRKGGRVEFEPAPGKPLMPQLRHQKVGIIGLCNGNAVCGSCHVYVDKERLDQLPEPDEFELERIEELPDRRDNSRLTCQFEYTPELDGIEITVAPRS